MITKVEEFKKSLDQVFKCHHYIIQQAKYAYLLEDTVGTAHDLALLSRGQKDCFEERGP